ncbi:MAG: hypothetical protein RR370_01685, partial [Synergistaceae bacterium]
MIVPSNPAVNLPTFRAVDNTGKCIFTAVNSFLSVRTTVKIGSSEHFFLNLHIKVAGDNRFVIVFYIILWNNTFIFHSLFGKDIYGIGLLQKGITN